MRNLQKLELPKQEEALYFELKKIMDNDVNITVLVGIRDKVVNKIYPSHDYHSHDEVRKILRNVSQYLSDESEQSMLRSMVRGLPVGQSRLYRMPFEEHE